MTSTSTLQLAPAPAPAAAAADIDTDRDAAATGDHDAFSSLPQDLLASILSHLDVAGRARAARVCRRWRAAALQPPHSTTLMLHVFLRPYGPAAGAATGGAGAAPAAQESLEELAARLTLGRMRAVSGERVVLLDAKESAAVLRGPLCSCLQRLSLILDLRMPPEDVDFDRVDIAVPPEGQIEALGALGAALPPTLLALTVVQRGLYLAGTYECTWEDVLEYLGWAHAAPRLDRLRLASIGDGEDVACMRLSIVGTFSSLGLEFSHPSLRRLSARVVGEFGAGDCGALEIALRRVPRLEVIDAIEVDRSRSGSLAVFAGAGIRTELLEADGLDFGQEHLKLLKPGAVLRLSNSTLPAGEGAALPLGLAELRLAGCSMSPKLLELLLGRTETYAPRLAKLHIDSHCLQRNVDPEDVVAALQGLAGGTQVEISWPAGGRWRATGAVRRLVGLLATSPVVARFVHIELGHPFISPLHPDIARDYGAYRHARARALREMGAAGLATLVAQGYGVVPLDVDS